jgi:spore maturation protein CgeB
MRGLWRARWRHGAWSRTRGASNVERIERSALRWIDAWWRPLRPARRKNSAHGDLTVALIADDLTRSCLEQECRVVNLGPADAEATLRRCRPALLFVESAWAGLRNRWKFRIASYSDHPERTNADLARVLGCARDLGIPAVFWNKEDGVHFDRFIASARLFDFIFTVDESCVPRYREALGREVFVAPLMFAVEPLFHHFAPPAPGRRGACFVGSYGWHVHDQRRERQDMLLASAAARLGLTIHDRNSDRRSGNYRYPSWPRMSVRPKVPYNRTGRIYQQHLVSLNVNTVEDSTTMFSRRLIEIIASGGLAVSTPARSIERWFGDYCHVVADAEQAGALFERLARDGYSARDCEMMCAGAEYVLAHHTYTQRLQTILGALSDACA